MAKATAHCELTPGEAGCDGEPVTVTISARLHGVYASGGKWWARVELAGETADFAQSISVPLISVRMAERLHPRVEAPG
jgi:hypothetical protein